MRFFFSSRRRHTRSKRDWSSDVCSSDLLSATEPERKDKRSLFALLPGEQAKNGNATERFINQYGVHVIGYTVTRPERHSAELACFLGQLDEIGKASCRERGEICGVRGVL